MVRRHALVAASLFALVAACSSADEPSCRIGGTYTMTATPDIQTEGCSDLPQGPTSSAVTLTPRPAGATGPDFALEMQGLSGACAVNQSDTCKLDGKCDVTIIDATDPANNIATLQITWTFTESGFSGLNSGSFPAAKSLPRGCAFTSKANGTRR